MDYILSALSTSLSKPNKPNKLKPNPPTNESIQAFRTITSMLALIQSPEINNDLKYLSTEQRRELRVLDSLASLSVRQHEIVAVTEMPMPSGVQVIISVVNTEPTLSVPQSAEKTWFQHIFTVNPRTSDPKFPPSAHDAMKLVDPDTTISSTLKILTNEEPSKSANEKLLSAFLQTEWGQESFHSHLWMLKTLLGRSKNDLETLQLYSVAASFPKMLSRMNNRHVSIPFRTHLDGLKGKIEYVQAVQSLPDRKSSKNGSHDEKFLLHVIPGITDFVKANIPNLKAMSAAVAADSDKNKDFKIYNKDTCSEFHDLLCELLDRFHSSLRALADLKSMTVRRRVNKEQAEEDTIEIWRHLRLVLVMGRSLREMVRSNAMVEHLRNIAPLLKVNVGKAWAIGVEEDIMEEDTEFHILKPYSTRYGQILQPWESYHNWLGLMVHHLDSVYVLDHYLRQHDSLDIRVKILYPSPITDKKMLTWRALLGSKNYFPDGDHPSNEELVTFLTSPALLDIRGVREILDSLTTLKQNRTSEIAAGAAVMVVESNVVDALIERMRALQSSLPGWTDYSTSIIDRMTTLKESGRSPHDGRSLIQVILDMVEALRGSNLLSEALRDDRPLSKGNMSTGTCHCESTLGSLESRNLVEQPTPQIVQLQKELRGSKCCVGTSKRCCPACGYLLKILTPFAGGSFYTSGEHSRITPCTLPEWLSQEIVDEMVAEFAKRLRKELVKLQRTTEVLRRPRARTNETQRMSLDSVQERPQDFSYLPAAGQLSDQITWS